MLPRLQVRPICSKSNNPALSRRHIIVTAIIAALLAAIIAVLIIMVLIILPIIMVVLINALPIIMAIAIIAALLAAIIVVLIAGVIIIRTVIITAGDGGITFNATSTGAFIKKAAGLRAWRFFFDGANPERRFSRLRLGNWAPSASPPRCILIAPLSSRAVNPLTRKMINGV